MNAGADIKLASCTGAFSVSVVRTHAQMKNLAHQWKELEDTASTSCNAFQHYDWCWQWASRFTAPGTHQPGGLFIIAVHQANQLVSIWPLEIIRHGPVKVLCWLSGNVLEYGGALFHNNIDHRQVFDCVWPVLTSAPADLVQLQAISETHPLDPVLASLCRCNRQTLSFQIDLSRYESWQDWQQHLSASARRARNKRFNKLKRQGKLEFLVHKGGSRYSYLAETAINWKRRWLKERRWPGGLMEEEEFKGFLTSLGHHDEQARQAWVACELQLDGEPLAIEIGNLDNNRYLSFLGAYDLSWSKYSPGKTAMSKMIEWCFANGIESYDLLCNHSQYKDDWANVVTRVHDYSLPMSATGRLWHSVWLKRLKPGIKAGLERMPSSMRGALVAVHQSLLHHGDANHPKQLTAGRFRHK